MTWLVTKVASCIQWRSSRFARLQFHPCTSSPRRIGRQMALVALPAGGPWQPSKFACSWRSTGWHWCRVVSPDRSTLDRRVEDFLPESATVSLCTGWAAWNASICQTPTAEPTAKWNWTSPWLRCARLSVDDWDGFPAGLIPRPVTFRSIC